MGFYTFLDKFFFLFHSSLIIFNLFGWAWKKTRPTNLVLLFLTVFSWFFLGIWYGFGYCPSTDWHWQVRAKLGYSDMPNSYIYFLVESLTGLKMDPGFMDKTVVAGLILALIVSFILNTRDLRKKAAKKRNP